MSAESIEFATIKADHFMHCETPSCCVVGSRHDEDHEYNNGHCLLYRLAVEVERLARKVAGVEEAVGRHPDLSRLRRLLGVTL